MFDEWVNNGIKGRLEGKKRLKSTALEGVGSSLCSSNAGIPWELVGNAQPQDHSNPLSQSTYCHTMPR